MLFAMLFNLLVTRDIGARVRTRGGLIGGTPPNSKNVANHAALINLFIVRVV